MFKRLMSNESMAELNELNNAYASRTRAMQKNWINDWVKLQQSFFATALTPGNQQTAAVSSALQQQMADQCNEYAKLVGNACESYSLWLIKQANSV